MPMWCSSSDTPRLSPQGIPQPHHRIVRVPPGESVVLNSAERAPYLLLIEILNDDLDFDASKRNNKEILKKIVLREDERKGAWRDLIPFNASEVLHRPILGVFNDTDVVAGDSPALNPASVVVVPATPTGSTGPEEEEEIDLVEQLYGADQSFRSQHVDLSESIVLPPAPKNKELDMAAWSSSLPSTPAMENSSSFKSPTNGVAGPSHNPAPSVDSTKASQALSLDEYSERMRTAAIMLAQLNANQELVTSQGAPMDGGSQSGPTSWLPGSRWLTNSSDQSNKPAQGSGQGHSHPARMRLQLSQASAIRDRIMKEMLALEEERMERMRENREADSVMKVGDLSAGMKTAEDEGIIRRELKKVDPSAVVFSESWTAKKVYNNSMSLMCAILILVCIQARIRHSSPYGHLGKAIILDLQIDTDRHLQPTGIVFPSSSRPEEICGKSSWLCS